MQQTSNAPTVPHPQAALVEAQNAQRIARRQAANTLAQSVQRTGRSDLRRGGRRQVGGTFEQIQDVPEPEQVSQQSMTQDDISRFLSAFRFDPQQQVLAESRSGQILPRSLLAPGTAQAIANQPGSSFVIQPGGFGGAGSPFSGLFSF